MWDTRRGLRSRSLTPPHDTGGRDGKDEGCLVTDGASCHSLPWGVTGWWRGVTEAPEAACVPHAPFRHPLTPPPLGKEGETRMLDLPCPHSPHVGLCGWEERQRASGTLAGPHRVPLSLPPTSDPHHTSLYGGGCER